MRAIKIAQAKTLHDELLWSKETFGLSVLLKTIKYSWH